MLERGKTTLLLSLLLLTGYGSTAANERPAAESQPLDAQFSIQAEQAGSEELIRTAFDEHCEYFQARMYRRLAKDRDGNSDTCVLYDVQMHMQNVAICADERGDKEILD